MTAAVEAIIKSGQVQSSVPLVTMMQSPGVAFPDAASFTA
jgi:hypothetical protein